MEANNSNAKRKYENPMPVTDEGWWESVLAEERQYAPPRPPQGGMKPKAAFQAQVKADPLLTVPAIQTDWDTIKDLYAHDRIVEMKATAWWRKMASQDLFHFHI
jgi:hypothetical protein